MSKAWKREEARCCELFGLRRKPLSGNLRAGIGQGDCMTKDGKESDIFLEIKSWKAMPLIKHIEKTRKEAKGKPWILAIHKKGSPNRYGIVDLQLLAKLFRGEKDEMQGL